MTTARRDRARCPTCRRSPRADAGSASAFDIDTWFGLFGPARLPQATVDQLHAAFAAALGHADTVERFARMGATPSPTSPAEFAALVKREHERYGQIIRGRGYGWSDGKSSADHPNWPSGNRTAAMANAKA